jgi:hypothetical protein
MASAGSLLDSLKNSSKAELREAVACSVAPVAVAVDRIPRPVQGKSRMAGSDGAQDGVEVKRENPGVEVKVEEEEASKRSVNIC